MRKTQFTKFLNSLTEEELREELDKLYSKYKPIKEYYTMELGSVDDRKILLDRTKAKIIKLYERRKTRSRLSKINALLKDIAMISIFDHELADVYITHAEASAQNMRRFHNPKDAEVASMLKSFKNGINLTLSSGSLEENKPRFEEIILKMNRYYWVVNDLRAYYEEMFPE